MEVKRKAAGEEQVMEMVGLIGLLALFGYGAVIILVGFCYMLGHYLWWTVGFLISFALYLAYWDGFFRWYRDRQR